MKTLNYSIWYSVTNKRWYLEDGANGCVVDSFTYESDAQAEADRLNAS